MSKSKVVQCTTLEIIHFTTAADVARRLIAICEKDHGFEISQVTTAFTVIDNVCLSVLPYSSA